MSLKISMDGIQELESELARLNSIRWDGIRKKQVVELLNRARAPGGTPVSTEQTRPKGPHGELRISSGTSGDEMGYTADYSGHVEFGHRTRSGGFVPGQYYLKKNVDVQRDIYRRDLLNAVRKEKS